MSLPKLGVVIVTYNSADIVLDCLESLWASDGVRLAIVVVDNRSTDGTPRAIRDWAAGCTAWKDPGDLPFALSSVPKPIELRDPATQGALPAESEGHGLTLIDAGLNGGFAAGVNLGLARLEADAELDRFWVLNPDSVVPPNSAAKLARAPEPFGLLGSRVLYVDPPDIIQIDGGTINRRTGVTINLGLGCRDTETLPADPAKIDFITGSSMVASRAFYEAAGPMPEDYFLYYEEVDWAMRRGDLPLAYAEGAVVYHRAGTSIGSPRLDRPASPFSLYFKHRGRMRFVRRHLPASRASATLYSLAKAAQLALKGYRAEARAVLAGSFDRPPPAEVRDRLSPEAARRAFA